MYRGSSSSHARAYKAAGHVNEDDFGAIVGGSNEGLNPQGKTDWKDDSGRTYSVKRGHGCKKWQIFLYGYDRVVGDTEFRTLGNVGKLLGKALNCFPSDYSKYLEDKNKVKKFLVNILKNEHSGLVLLDAVRSEFAGKNFYLDSKTALSEVTADLRDELSEFDSRAAFMRKAMFNNTEVSHLAISQESVFEIYPRELVVETLALKLKVAVSIAGTNKTDLNVPGQKVVMKGATNVVEIEIRNDSVKHYRQVRFNMVTAPAIELLQASSQPSVEKSPPGAVWMKKA
jgi:hypothetical protein